MTRSPLALVLLALLAGRQQGQGGLDGLDAGRVATWALGVGAAVLAARLLVLVAAAAGLVLAGVALVVGLSVVGPLTAP